MCTVYGKYRTETPKLTVITILIMKRIVFLVVTLLVALSSIADNKLDLKDITSGKFRAESMPMVKPCKDKRY